MCHVLCVTCFVSRVMRHALCVTRYVSRVMSHVLSLYGHAFYVLFCRSEITHFTSRFVALCVTFCHDRVIY